MPIDPQKPDLVQEDQLAAMLMRPGKIRAVMCLGLLAVVLFVAFFLQEFNTVLMGILAFLATIGVFAVLAFSAGILTISSDDTDTNIFAAYAENLTEGILITDKKGEVIYANDAYFHILKRPRGKVVPTVENFFSGDPSIAEPLYRLCQAAGQKRAWEDEFAIEETERSVDGEEPKKNLRWLRISVRPLNVKDGMNKLSGIVWRVADITLERGVRDEEYKDLITAVRNFDQAPMGFFTITDEGDVTYMNGTMAAWLGLQSPRHEPLNITQIMTTEGVQLLTQSLTPYSQLRSVQYYDLVAADGSTVSTILFGRPTEADDEALETERSEPYQYSIVALKAEDAPQLYEPQRMTEMRLEQFYHSAPIGIATINKDGEISNANGSFRALMGQGQTVATEAGAEQANNLFKTIISGAEELHTALNNAVEGYAVIAPVDVQFAPSGESSGRLYLSPARDMAEDGAVGIIYAVDISKQKLLEEQFAQSQKMQAVGQLAGGIAHDFNNVLTAIIGYCDLLISSHRPTDPAFKDMMHIKQNANRAASLVRHLLAFSRQQTLRPEVLSLNDVIQDVTAMLSRLLGEKVELNVVHGRDLWAVKADHHQFDQVIINLAVNARDAMVGGGTLTLKTENIAEHRSLDDEKRGLVPGEYVLLEITDTGSGMPQEVIEKIFEPFFTTKDIGKGTGLGLSMVYGIVKQTDGYIFVDSIEGEGTSFKIFLPRYVADENEVLEAPVVPVIEVPRDMTGTETVLLVEDEEAVRSFAVRALSIRGYNVLEANSGVDALSVVAAHDGEIDLIISDVMMPEMDGPTMLSQLRDTLPKVKVIFISGYAEDAFDKNLQEGESFTFLPKPFSLKQLAATVKEVLEA